MQQTKKIRLPENIPIVKKSNSVLSASVAVVGLGYVGLPLALLCARKNYRVFGIDNDQKKILGLSHKKSPFYDENISEGLINTKAEFYSDASYIKNADIVIICVPTPVYDDHMPNLEPLIRATRTVAENMTRGTLVIIESTINPGVSEDIVLPLLEEVSGLVAGLDFELSHCPERINPGDKNWDVSKIPRVVGSLTKSGLSRSVAFYESIIDAKIHPMQSLKEAEAVKVVENSFRDVNIAFVNELAMSFSKLGIDVVNVINGASTKPFSFMAHYPGCGVGGHCIPVDPYYLINYGKQNGFNHEFLSTARKINNYMPIFTVKLVEKSLAKLGMKLSKAKVAVLGLSYKSNIDDVRESPAFEIINELKKKGASVVTYDPYTLAISNAKDMESAIKGSDVVIVATAHKDFIEKLKPEYIKNLGVKAVVDGRNCLSKEEFVDAGLMYEGIGR